MNVPTIPEETDVALVGRAMEISRDRATTEEFGHQLIAAEWKHMRICTTKERVRLTLVRLNGLP
jgi:hypothetical protein